MSDSDAEITIEEIADSFAARLERGEHPSIIEYKEKYPHLAERIDAVFPALVMLEKVESQPSGRKLAIDDSIPETLGEYRIIQEIGRGGMGIVFEAQHNKMRRRVALKVLPKSAAEKPNYLSRFLTEARSAGRLHHTNIVPVFEYGESDGLNYYSMQFIHGDNLDRVIEDIKHLRTLSGQFNEPNDDGEHNSVSQLEGSKQQQKNDVIGSGLSESIALNFMNGALQTMDAPESNSVSPNIWTMETREALDSSLGGPKKGDTNSDGDTVPQSTDLDAQILSDSVFGSDSTSISRTRSVYHQRVAAVGVQVADALDYAHNRQILHRDVKPANLILDTDGTVWVTDFGLAKLETDDLTHTGDIIGTLRYMAPERFKGQADRRSDVYSLGLTLYELCTLQCAFTNDQANLLSSVENRSVVAPRKIDESIPADLETIILKSIEAQPDRRYQTAREMAEDLELFLADRPIRARRVTLVERFWRVCRRNPTLATMGACIAALLLILALGSLRFAWYSAKKTVEETESRKASQRDLFQSKLDQARLGRFSQRLGQRYDSLAAIRQAVELLPQLDFTEAEQEKVRLDLRNEAVAALTLTDMREIWRRPIKNHWGRSQSIAFDSSYSKCAQGHSDGRIRIVDLASDSNKEPVILPSPGTPAWVLKMSPDGKYLAAFNNRENALYRDVMLSLWNLDEPAAPVFQTTGVSFVDFSSDNKRLVFASEGKVHVVDLEPAGQVEITQSIEPGFIPRIVQVSRDGTEIAVTERGGKKIEIWELSENPIVKRELEIDGVITSMDWCSENSILAVGTWRRGVYLWNGDYNLDPVNAPIHQNTIKRIHIDPHRELIATGSLDSTVRLTDLNSGKQSLLVDKSVYLLDTGFSQDSRLCFTDFRSQEFGVWEISDPALKIYSNSSAIGIRASFHPNYPSVVARSTSDGLELWDVENRKLLTSLTDEPYGYFRFSNDGETLFTSGDNGLKRRSLKINKSQQGEIQIDIGDPKTLMSSPTRMIELGKSDQHIFVAIGFQVVKADSNDGSHSVLFGSHKGLANIQVSADGKWLLTSTQLGKGVGVWDTETGSLEKMLADEHSDVTVSAHPTENRFAINGGKIGFWKIGTWDTPRSVDYPTFVTAVGRYSSDGKLFSIKDSTNRLMIMQMDSHSKLLELESLNSSRLVDYRFSSDEAYLALSCVDGLQILSMSGLRSELNSLGLDW